MKGNDLILTDSGGNLYASKSCELKVQGEYIEIATAGTADWREYIAGRKDWNITTSYLVSDNKIKSDASMVGQTLSVKIGRRDGQDSELLHGSAIVSEWHTTATRGNLVQGSFMLKGTGPLI